MLKAIGGITALAIVFAAIPASVRAQEAGKAPSPEAIAKAMEEAAKPAPEHRKLEPLAGKWTYTSKFSMDPSQPPMESTGTIERHWILGKRFLEELVVGKGPDGSDFEGRGVVGYDKAEGKYTYGWICSMGTGISTSTGTVDSTGKHFTFHTEAFCPIRGRKIKGRDEIRIESNDKHVIQMYQFDDGKELKVMELTAVRKK
jgi:hypothetical protein